MSLLEYVMGLNTAQLALIPLKSVAHMLKLSSGARASSLKNVFDGLFIGFCFHMVSPGI